MSRKLLINIHLYLAALFTPLVILMSISGGLYLLGSKGIFESEQININSPVTLSRDNLEADVRALLQSVDADYDFEYLKVKGNNLYTRPTSKTHYHIKTGEGRITLYRQTPDLIASIVELHKGHGPKLFKQLQIALSIALLLVMISGVYLGLQSPLLKKRTLLLVSTGAAVTLLLSLI